MGEEFAARFEVAFVRLRIRIETACAGEREWPAKVAATIRTTFAFATEHRDDARVLTTEALTSGEAGQLPYRRMIDYFARLLRPGRDLDPGNGDLPAILESAMAGGVALLVGRRLDQGLEEELSVAATEAIEFVLIPYVGIEDARRLAREHRTERADLG